MSFPLAGAALLRPVIALNAWTFVMEIWMYKTRLAAISKYNITPDPKTIKQQMETKAPAEVHWAAHNFNHLHEQPTVFYAVAIVLALIAPDDKLNAQLAWAYVGIRVAHSIWQAAVNQILPRFYMFATSSIVLAALTSRAVMILI